MIVLSLIVSILMRT